MLWAVYGAVGRVRCCGSCGCCGWCVALWAVCGAAHRDAVSLFAAGCTGLGWNDALTQQLLQNLTGLLSGCGYVVLCLVQAAG